MNDTDLQEQARRIKKYVQIGILGIAGFVVAPFILLAIKGLLGLGLLILLGLGAFNLAPVIGDKIGNWRLQALKAEAAKNPIETLQTDYGMRLDALHQFKQAITTFSAAVKNFADRLDGFKSNPKITAKDAAKFDDQLMKMKKLLEVRRKRYKEAELALEQYDGEIEKAKAIWEMGLEAAKMNAAAGMSDEDFLQKIKVETALDSVQTSMNTAFAELETSLLEEDDEKAIVAQHAEQEKPATRMDRIEVSKK